MKVLFDHQIFLLQKYGGISRYHHNLLQNLRAFFPESSFDVAHRGTNNFYLDGNKQMLEFKGRTKVWGMINKRITMRQLGRYDVFHPTYYDPYFLTAGKEVKYALTVHDMIPERELQNGERQLKKLVQTKKQLIEKASAVIAISEATKKDILRYTNAEPDRITVIYHGGPDIYNHASVSANEDTLPQRYFLYIGERNGYKNFLYALEALAPLLRDEELKLIAAGGKSPTLQELSTVERLGLKNYVQFRQNLTETQLVLLYQNAICFLYPSLIEGFGIPLLEAFSAGCPVLCSEIECFTEIAQDAALFFQPDSVDSLRSAAQKIYGCEQLRKSLIEKGKHHLTKFTWQKTALATYDVYGRLFH